MSLKIHGLNYMDTANSLNMLTLKSHLYSIIILILLIRHTFLLRYVIYSVFICWIARNRDKRKAYKLITENNIWYDNATKQYI